MRFWIIQGIEIYEQLERDGIDYCSKPIWGDEDKFMYAYHWISRQLSGHCIQRTLYLLNSLKEMGMLSEQSKDD